VPSLTIPLLLLFGSPLALLCVIAVAAPTRTLKLQVDEGRIEVLRLFVGLIVHVPGVGWRLGRAPYRHDGLEVDWPHPLGDGTVRWRADAVTGGEVTWGLRLLHAMYGACLALLLVLSLLVVAGQVTRAPVVSFPDKTIVGHRLVMHLETEVAPATPLSCEVDVLHGQPVVSLFDRPVVVDFGAEGTIFWGDRAPLPLADMSTFRGPFAVRARGFGAMDAAALHLFVARQASLCGVSLPDQMMYAVATSLDVELAGMLGLSTLGGGVVELDLAELDLRVHEALDAVDVSGLVGPLPLTGAGAVIEATYAGRPVTVQFDTGAAHTSVRPGLHGLLPPLEGRKETITIRGGTGGVQGVAGKRRLVRLAPFCLDPGGTVCMEELLADADVHDVDINLGTDALWGRTLVLDLKSEQLWVSPERRIPAEVRDATDQIRWKDAIREAFETYDQREVPAEEPKGP
jgi:hypothetical protein